MGRHAFHRSDSSPARRAGVALVLAAGLVALSCGGEAGSAMAKHSSGGTSSTAAASDQMGATAAQTLTGAGSTFIYPVLSQWADQYSKLKGVRLNYQPVGSGAGIAQIKAKTVEFGASDAPLTRDELDQAGLVQFPAIVGGVVLAVHLQGVQPGQLKLTPGLLADIYLGKVKKWNDPAIKKVNPGLSLPDKGITTVHRSDGSGTTWIFTNYLSKVSPEWKQKVGNDKAVQWPGGVGGKGNQGVSGYIQRIDGAIGYVEYAYAIQSHMTYTQLQNEAGKFVSPEISSFMAAAGNADWKNAPGFYMVVTDQPGDDTWPITGATFVLVHKQPESADQLKEVLRFFDWSYKNGQAAAKKLDYVPIPDNVVQLIESKWQSEISGNVWP